MKLRLRVKAWELIIIVICIFLFSLQLKVWFPAINSLVVLGVGFLLTLFISKNYYTSAKILSLVIYSFVLLLNYFSGDYYFQRIPNIAEEFFLLSFPVALFYYIVTNQKFHFARLLIICLYIYIIYSTIATFIVNIRFPDAVRTSVFLSNVDDTDTLQLYYGMGMVPYRFPHALPIIIPSLVFVLRSNIDNRFFKQLSALTLVSIFVIEYLSNAATPFFLSVAMLFLSIFAVVKKRSVSILLYCVLFIFVLLVIDSGLIDKSFALFTDDDKVFSSRFNEILAFSDSGQARGDIESRFSHYRTSYYLWFENILLGSNVPTGGHSALMDRLASVGLIGFIPYLFYVFGIFYDTSHRFKSGVKIYYIFGVSAGIIMLGTKNMSNWDTWFMLLCMLPLILWISIQQNKQHNIHYY